MYDFTVNSLIVTISKLNLKMTISLFFLIMTIVIDLYACAFTCVLLKAVVVSIASTWSNQNYSVQYCYVRLIFQLIRSSQALPSICTRGQPANILFSERCGSLIVHACTNQYCTLVYIIQVAVDLRSEAKDQVNLLDKSVRFFRPCPFVPVPAPDRLLSREIHWIRALNTTLPHRLNSQYSILE